MSSALIAGAALAQTGLNVLGTRWAQKRQAEANMALARYQNAQNQLYLKQQLEYDKPANQMARFKEAGLNPNLIYDKGSSGNQGSPLQFPEIKPTDMSIGQIGNQLMDNLVKTKQAQLLGTQADLNKVKVDSETKKQSLMEAQKAVLKANPYLDAEYFNSVVRNMTASATIKEQDQNAGGSTIKSDALESFFPNIKIGESEITMKQAKYLSEFQDFLNRTKLQSADLTIKNEIFKSKVFQNEFDQIQNAWMKDGEFTADSWRQMILMLFRALAK